MNPAEIQMGTRSDTMCRGVSVVTNQILNRLPLILVLSFVLVAAPVFSQGECRWNEGHFPQGPVGDVRAMAVYDDGVGRRQLYAGGWFARAGGIRAFGVARWDGRRWHPTGDEEQPGLFGTARDLVAVRTGPLEGLYAVGAIVDVIRYFGDAVARWDGERWMPVPGQPRISDARAAAQFEDGDGQGLYVAGRGSDYGEWARASLNRWNGQEWNAVPGTTFPDEMSGSIRALLVFDDGAGPALYAGGEFELLGENGSENIARLTCVPTKSVEVQE